MRIRALVPLLAIGLLAAALPRNYPVAPTVEIAIGKSIEAGNPTDTASTFDAAVGTVVCWTRVTGATAGSKVSHVWMRGTDSTKIDLNIGGSPWRTYSRKNVGAGDWKVEVRDESGAVLATKTFKVG